MKEGLAMSVPSGQCPGKKVLTGQGKAAQIKVWWGLSGLSGQISIALHMRAPARVNLKSSQGVVVYSLGYWKKTGQTGQVERSRAVAGVALSGRVEISRTLPGQTGQTTRVEVDESTRMADSRGSSQPTSHAGLLACRIRVRFNFFELRSFGDYRQRGDYAA